MHTATSQPVGPAAVPAVARRLLASPNPQQQRVGHDLTRLLGLTARGGLWAGRCRPVALQALEDGGLGVILEMAVAGMIWDGQQPQRHDGGFTLALLVPSQYPHAKPDVRVLSPIPFNPHVIHPSCRINEADLPRELLEHIERIRRQESGWCCFIRSSVWQPTAEYDLALCLYLVSAILTGHRMWGERGCLNPLALQWFERERGRLALGDPLPFPHGRLAAGDGVPPAGDDEEDPMAWEETTAGEPQ